MARTNEYFEDLPKSYLFSEIARRTKEFKAQNPGVEVMRLGIGNTTEPLKPTVLYGLRYGVDKLGAAETYTGYGDEQGNEALRKAIANHYKRRGVNLSFEEVFVSDGAKPDTANIQRIFAQDSIVAIQDPVYPVYLESNVIAGRAGTLQSNGYYDRVVYMVSNEANGFVPNPPEEHADLIYICSPNNPTGAALTHPQLKDFVNYARNHRSALIFDAAYSRYISNPNLPVSIYEIDGADECAIEINSFSKSDGFTGIRAGWTIVPHAMVVEGAEEGKVRALWNRRQTTMFNGASNIVQEGALAALSEAGLAESLDLVSYYMRNADNIRQALANIGLTVFGGVNAPYIWMKTPNGLSSLEFFDKLLNETHVVGTPGSGFGPAGEGYFRLSAFGHRGDINDAIVSILRNLKL